jgi:hypothetical protein
MVTLAKNASQGDTTQTVVNSTNRNELFGTLVQYQMRKIGFKGAYNRIYQNISATGLAPRAATTYYFGVYRWFNFY